MFDMIFTILTRTLKQDDKLCHLNPVNPLSTQNSSKTQWLSTIFGFNAVCGPLKIPLKYHVSTMH